jgi:hypothetical protein
MGDGVVDWPADDTEVEEDRHSQFLGSCVGGEVVGLVVRPRHADELQAPVPQAVQPMHRLRIHLLRVDDGHGDEEVRILP